MTSFGAHSIEQIWNPKFSHLDLVSLAQKITVDQPSVVFLSLLWERFEPQSWSSKFQDLVHEIKQLSTHTKIELVLDSVYQNWIDQQIINTADHVTFVDFFAISLWHRVIELQQCVPCDTWNHTNTNFLFLTGKPDKANRIRLLHKFDQQHMLDQCVWSLFCNDHYKAQCRPLLTELDNTQFDNFVDQHIRNPDSITVVDKANGTLHYGGTPFDTRLYENCAFQVVSETLFANPSNHPVWITEKTWLAILNRRPFISAGEAGLLNKLQQMGFRTFEQYLLIDQYDSMVDNEHRLNAVVANTKHWLANISKYATQIQADIDHNFQQFQTLIEKNQEKLNKRIVAYNIDCGIDDVVSLIDIHQHSQWQNWYQRIRDSSWPDCPTEQDFWNLPDVVRTECMEVFGYKPKEKI